jgi:hypothetical protein
LIYAPRLGEHVASQLKADGTAGAKMRNAMGEEM